MIAVSIGRISPPPEIAMVWNVCGMMFSKTINVHERHG